MALNKNRYTARLGEDGRLVRDPLAADTHIYSGALVALDAAGNLAPGSAATGLKARGVACGEVDNTGGAAGALEGDVESGVFLFDNDGSIDRTSIGGTAYIVDDESVAADDGASTRSAAGAIVDLDDDGVWIRIGV